MSSVTVTATLGTTCNYWITPEPVWNTSGSGLELPLGIQSGYVSAGDVLTLDLDNSTSWDVYMEFQGAAPVIFPGLNVTGGGDLFELLAAQGWTSL
jgi:hypothetical protein